MTEILYRFCQFKKILKKEDLAPYFEKLSEYLVLATPSTPVAAASNDPSKFLKTAEQVVEEFLKISPKNTFLKDIRKFLNILNASIKKESRTLFTYKCSAIKIGTQDFNDKEDLYVDFGSQALSFSVSYKDGPFPVDLKYECIRTLRLSGKTSEMIIQMHEPIEGMEDIIDYEKDEHSIQLFFTREGFLLCFYFLP